GGQISAVAPSGMTPGTYDVIVVNPPDAANPTGAVGVKKAAYTVVANKPPKIDDIAPGSMPVSADGALTVFGNGFSVSPLATAQMTCQDTSNAVATYTNLTVNPVGATS